MSVSYTHLDVYKRQSHVCLRTMKSFYANTMKTKELHVCSRLTSTINSIQPVSYTHLIERFELFLGKLSVWKDKFYQLIDQREEILSLIHI